MALPDTLRILLVDDDEDDQVITRSLLHQAFAEDFVLDCVSTWDEAAAAIRHEQHDVYLIDYGLGKGPGIDLVREATISPTMAPVIMLTGADSRAIDLAAQAAGAADYLLKRELSAPLLDRAIRYAIERKNVERRLVSLAQRDSLTGLVNRSRFRTLLESAIHHAQRGKTLLAVVLLDLDDFKDVNDTLGHPAGDVLLQQVSVLLESLVRDTDTVARLGGDEFAIIATHLSNAGDASVLARKILSSLSKPIRVADSDVYVSTSICITLCPEDGNDPDQVLKNADLALYKAKAEGRGNSQFYSDKLNAEALARKSIEAELRTALSQNAFRLHYQPKIDLDTGQMVGVEALVRWQRDDGSLTMPDDFIPAAETSGLIVPLGEWVLREACLQKRAWDRSGLLTGPVAVNLSAVQLRRDEFALGLIKIVDDIGVEPSGIQIEVTESAIMDHGGAGARRLGLLRNRGMQLAIDDFGTGYSSLSHLKRFPVNILKIDRSFVRGIQTDRDDAAIVRAIIQLGASLDLTVIAEGVETAAQVEFLQRRGCRIGQGWYYSKALAPASLAHWMSDFQPVANLTGVSRG